MEGSANKYESIYVTLPQIHFLGKGTYLRFAQKLFILGKYTIRYGQTMAHVTRFQ